MIVVQRDREIVVGMDMAFELSVCEDLFYLYIWSEYQSNGRTHYAKQDLCYQAIGLV